MSFTHSLLSFVHRKFTNSSYIHLLNDCVTLRRSFCLAPHLCQHMLTQLSNYRWYRSFMLMHISYVTIGLARGTRLFARSHVLFNQRLLYMFS